MTFRYLRNLFALVPVFVAVGIVAACGTYLQPPAIRLVPAQPQVYYYPAPITPPPTDHVWNL